MLTRQMMSKIATICYMSGLVTSLYDAEDHGVEPQRLSRVNVHSNGDASHQRSWPRYLCKVSKPRRPVDG